MIPNSFSLTFFPLMLLCLLNTSDSAPSFKFKKSFSTYSQNPMRVERRLSGGSSPIHYINPFMSASQSMNAVSNFFAPAISNMGSPSSSSVYKLPLRLFNNGKPSAVFHGFPKTQNVLEFLPQAMSNIIRLPLKYLSNAKPVGLYYKNPAYNFI